MSDDVHIHARGVPPVTHTHRIAPREKRPHEPRRRPHREPVEDTIDLGNGASLAKDATPPTYSPFQR